VSSAAPDAGLGRRVVHGSALRLASFGAANVLAALGAVLVLRYLGVEQFGRYGTVLALLTIVQGISDAGLSVTAVRELSLLEDAAERRKLLAHVLGARVLLTGVGLAAAVAFAAVAGYRGELVLGTAIGGIGILLSSIQAAMVLPLAVDLRNGAIALNELIRHVVLVAGLVLLVILEAPLLAFFAVQVAVGLALLAVAPALVGRRWIVRPRWTTRELRALAQVGLPVALASVVGVLYARVLVIVVSLLADDRDTGLFVTSTRIFEIVAALPVLLSMLIIPVLTVAARDDDARLHYVMQRMTEVMALAGVAIALGVGAAAEPVIRIFGGSEYVDATPILQLQCLALVTLFLSAAWTSTLVSIGRPGGLAVASLAGLTVVVVAGTVMTELAGIRGAAGAAVAADVVLLGVLLGALRRAGPGRALELRFLQRLSLAAAPALGLVLFGGLPGLLAGVLGPLVLLAGAFLLGLVPGEILDALRRRRVPAP